jgi:hypothetical protein
VPQLIMPHLRGTRVPIRIMTRYGMSVMSLAAPVREACVRALGVVGVRNRKRAQDSLGPTESALPPKANVLFGSVLDCGRAEWHGGIQV